MKKWKLVLTQGVLAGSLASLFSTAVLAIAGRRQAGSAAAPGNAVSHGYWRDQALHRERADLAPTASGYLAHHVAAAFWATLYAALARDRPALRSTPGVILGAVATSATACLADFKLAPRRFTPGYGHRLSTGALAAVYAAFAVGLAAGAMALRDQDSDEEKPQELEVDEQAEPAPRITRRVRAGNV